MRPFHVPRGIETLDAGDFFGRPDPLVVQVARVLFLFDLEVHVLLQLQGDTVGFRVLGDVVLGRARDNQRRSCLVDQDVVDLVHDGEVQRALNLQLLRRLHVVTQVVETELVVRAISNVASVLRLPLVRVHLRLDGAHR